MLDYKRPLLDMKNPMSDPTFAYEYMKMRDF